VPVALLILVWQTNFAPVVIMKDAITARLLEFGRVGPIGCEVNVGWTQIQQLYLQLDTARAKFLACAPLPNTTPNLPDMKWRRSDWRKIRPMGVVYNCYISIGSYFLKSQKGIKRHIFAPPYSFAISISVPEHRP
jgi:hypothetical protein